MRTITYAHMLCNNYEKCSFIILLSLSDEEIELLKWLTSIKPRSLAHGKTVLQIPDRLTYDFMKGLDSPRAS